jgi:hypothetical protein
MCREIQLARLEIWRRSKGWSAPGNFGEALFDEMHTVHGTNLRKHVT